MSQNDAQDSSRAIPESTDRAPLVRFRQIYGTVTDTGIYGAAGALVALSEDGVPYQFEWNETASTYIWRRMPVVSSTELRQGPCEVCGASPIDFLPGSGVPVRCRRHRFDP